MLEPGNDAQHEEMGMGGPSTMFTFKDVQSTAGMEYLGIMDGVLLSHPINTILQLLLLALSPLRSAAYNYRRHDCYRH